MSDTVLGIGGTVGAVIGLAAALMAVKDDVQDIPVRRRITAVLFPAVSWLIIYTLVREAFLQHGDKLPCFICLTGVIYINAAAADLFITGKKDRETLIKALEDERLNNKLTEEAYLEMKRLRHDIASQTEVIGDLIKKGEISSAEELGGSIIKDFNNCSVCLTGEPVIDSVINIKLTAAEEMGICVSNRINADSFDTDKALLSRILGNALDNAAEGCIRSGMEDKHIFLSIQQTEGKQLAIEISNTSGYTDINNLRTDKADKELHGIGMNSIRACVKKLGGFVSCNYKDGVFTLKIVI